MLSQEDFKSLVKSAPLFAIDLVLLNDQNQILLGQRKNPPAKDYWFVPGGRVFKGESLEQAVKRISEAEIGCELKLEQLSLLGIYDHFYDDSFFDSETTTHYINATHIVRLDAQQLELPTEQHRDYRWLSVQELESDPSVHSYSKIFLPNLKQWSVHD